MMRAARVLSVETDTAYTLRVRKQPAQLHVRMDAVPECNGRHVDYHGESPMAHGLTSGILVYYSGDHPQPGSSIAGRSQDHREAGVRLGS